MFSARSSFLIIRCLLLGLFFVLGCEGPGSYDSSLSQADQLHKEKTEMQISLEEALAENERLKKQVEGLWALPDDKKADALYQVQAIKIGKYTNLFDEDKDGTKETLVVYVEPIDETGDSIKAGGAADVQLWNLDKPSEGALISQWSIDTDELKQLWLDSMFGGNYRFKFDVSGMVGELEGPLTVKVTFTDYLSGRTFTEQKAIKP